MLTAHITQQEIMRQVVKDEELSADTTSLYGSISKMGDDGETAKTGEELLQAAAARERNTEHLRRTVNVFSKDLKKAGINRRTLLRAVMEDERQFKTCLTLPMTMLFSCIFIFFFQMHYNTSNMFLNETAIRARLTEAPYEARNFDDIYRWMDEILVPWLWSMPNVPNPQPSESDARAQLLVGGLSLVTARSTIEDPCSTLLGAGGNWSMPCTPPFDPIINDGWEHDESTGGRRLSTLSAQAQPLSWVSWLPSFLGGTRKTTFYYPPEETNQDRQAEKSARKTRKEQRKHELSRVVQDRKAHKIAQARAGMPPPLRTVTGILTKEQHQERQRRLKELKRGYLDLPVEIHRDTYDNAIPMSMPFAAVKNAVTASKETIDRRTLFLATHFVTRNEEWGLVTQTSVTFMVTRGGGILTMVQMQTNTVKMSMASLGVLAIFGILLLRLTAISIVTAVVSAKHNSFRRTVLKATGVTDWLLILMGWAIIAMVAFESLGMSSFEGDWSTFLDERKAIDAAQVDQLMTLERKWIRSFKSSLASVSEISDQLLTWVAVYTVLLVSRYLIATMGHPRLAVVVRPLLVGLPDLVHFLFVFMLVFIAYVLAGHILLGRRMEEFSTFKATFGYCLQIVNQRQFYHIKFTDENMFAAAFWIVTFVMALVLVLVNLMLAIIFNHYAAIRDEVGPNETVVGFMKRLLTQLRLQSAWISNTDLLVKLAQIPVGDTPSMMQVKRMFPEISDPQLELIFNSACTRSTQKLAADTKHALPEYFAGLLLMIRDVRKGLLHIQEASVEYNFEEEKASKPPAIALAEVEPAKGEGQVEGQPEAQPEGQETQADGNDQGLKPIAEGSEPPKDKPDWIHNGLNITLCERREALGTLLKQMEDLSKKMQARGMKGLAGLPLGKPAVPDFSTPFEVVDEGKDCSKY